MSLILVADVPSMDARYSAALAGWTLAFARTMHEARATLAAHRCAAVVIGVYFDDSQMFDLVRHIRAGGNHAARPVACVRSHRFASAASISFEGLEIAARALACNLFLDLTKYPDDARGNAEVRTVLDALLTP